MFEARKILALNRIAFDLYDSIEKYKNSFINKIESLNEISNLFNDSIISSALDTIKPCLQNGSFNGKSRLTYGININESTVTENDVDNTLSDLYAAIFCINTLNLCLKAKNRNKNALNLIKNIDKDNIIKKCTNGINERINKKD